jgi:hypothetical protein
MDNLDLNCIAEVAQDCREYAKQYNCSLAESVSDWEGDGPNGSWGLTREEQALVLETLEQSK